MLYFQERLFNIKQLLVGCWSVWLAPCLIFTDDVPSERQKHEHVLNKWFKILFALYLFYLFMISSPCTAFLILLNFFKRIRSVSRRKAMIQNVRSKCRVFCLSLHFVNNTLATCRICNVFIFSACYVFIRTYMRYLTT